MARPRLGAPRQIRRWRHTTPTHTRRGERERAIWKYYFSRSLLTSHLPCVLASPSAKHRVCARSVWPRVRAREEDMKTLRQNGAGTPPGGQTDMNRHTPNRHASPSLALGLSLTSRTLSFNSWASSSQSKLDVASARKAATAACLPMASSNASSTSPPRPSPPRRTSAEREATSGAADSTSYTQSLASTRSKVPRAEAAAGSPHASGATATASPKPLSAAPAARRGRHSCRSVSVVVQPSAAAVSPGRARPAPTSTHAPRQPAASSPEIGRDWARAAAAGRDAAR
mmetsp:Transcript_18972/g.56217  ORF Transcript_18972/g.56217 Transcript_18972/m.56217 type:complete len:285 (+) Transcript_18972:134-988(+)